ncbi:hypothetical protein [Bacillus wiedmannii]|uniref:hypothetical protein n=1 Tax=Bacillus wiedmannii TaxID=1890302 RepID=UPI0015CEF917|nr:hypothetical protein [Bacillus wiedmannii]
MSGEQYIKEAPNYRALPLLIYPAPAARMVGGFASSDEVKSTSLSEAPSSSDSE